MADIFTWIENILKPDFCTTDKFIYDDMESQSGRCLPIIYVPFDSKEKTHWRDRGALFDFLYATRAAGKKVLDFGPGDGWPSLIVAPYVSEVVGVDGSRRRVDVCRQNAAQMGISNAQFIHVSPGAKLPFDDNRFDAVMAASSIEQSPDPYATLKELFRVLKPGGRMRIEYEALGRYRQGRQQDMWLCRIDDHTCRLILFNRDIERECVHQYGLTYACSGEQLCLSLWGQPEPGPFSRLTNLVMEQARPVLIDARVCRTVHPSGNTFVSWLREIGFQEVMATYNGIDFADRMFSAVDAPCFPESLEAVDNLLRPAVKAVIELTAPVELDPTITAVK